ncbi:MAG: hypothetical protein K6D02_08735 [Lachnospiraceae bacterium]|nr:hypothetical protein [Lachnospiraceae bacterium]
MEKKKEKITLRKIYKTIVNNITLKIFAAIAAVIMWLLIINIEDPIRTTTFKVKVTTINAEAITSANKVYDIQSGETAVIRVSGKKSIIDRLSKKDVYATADLSALSSVNAVDITPHINKKYKKKVMLSCDDVMKVSLEDMEKKQIQVEVVTEGTVAEGNAIGECIAKPNILQITGGESAVNKIESIRVTVDVEGADASFSKKLTPVAYDASENVVTSPTLKFSSKKVKVSVDILNTKNIPIDIKISGKPKKGYKFVSAKCLPENIDITGKNSVLKSIEGVTIPVDISGMSDDSSDLEQNISVIDYLPNGVSLAAEYAMISVKLNIQKVVEKKLLLQHKKVNVENLADGYKVKILKKNESSIIKITGLENKLEDLDLSEYEFYVNAEGLKEGTYSLKLRVKENEVFELEDYTRIRVKITKDTSNDDSDSGDSSGDDSKSSPSASPKESDKSSKNEESESPSPSADE